MIHQRSTEQTRKQSLFVPIIAGVAVLLTILLSIALRLVDPLSTPVIPAEDPFTHMANIREHVRTGTIASWDENSLLYPPGLHALLAVVWVYTGMELSELIRFGPVVMGALGVLGMGIILWRYVGPVGGFVGALAYAVAPEVVFRTTMMAPTALDLALAPFLILFILEVAEGRMRWLPPFALITLFFVFAHPWLLGLLVLGTGMFVLLRYHFPTARTTGAAVSALGLASVIAVLGGAFGTAMTGCGGYCGPGLVNFLPTIFHPTWMAFLVIAVSVAPAILLAFRPHMIDGLLPKGRDRPLPIWIKFILSALIGAGLLAVTLPAMGTGMPEQVDLPRMIGWPILALAGFGLVALPFLAGRLAYFGAGFTAAIYPLVIYNLFDSPFWPHRTVVFLAIGAVILVGISAAAITRWVVTGISSMRQTLKRSEVTPTAMSSIVVLPALLVVASLGGTVYSATPEIYPGGWYRLYPECEYDALQEIADELNEDESALAITGSWESRLVLAAHTDDPSRVWFDPVFMLDYDRREDTLAIQANKGGAVYLVLDRHLDDKVSQEHLGFLDAHPWEHHSSMCAGLGFEHARLEMYWTGGPPV